VVAHLGIAVGEAVDGLVLLEPILLEGQPFDHLVELAAQHERDVPHAEIAAALRAMDGLAAGVGDAVDDELALAARALEDFRNHGSRIQSVPSGASAGAKFRRPHGPQSPYNALGLALPGGSPRSRGRSAASTQS